MVVQPTISELFQVIYRRKWSMLFVMLVVAGIGSAYIMAAVPLYRSDAAIVVRFGRSAGPVTNLARDSTPMLSDQLERRELIQAHAELLTSPDVAAAVINSIGLAKLYPRIPADPPAQGTLMDAAIKRFAANLSASPELTGDVIRLAFSSPDPALARETLRKLIEEYRRRENDIFSDTSFDFQKQQADLAAQRLHTAQAALTDFKIKSGISDYDTQMDALIKQQSELGNRLHMAQVSLVEATQRQDTLTKLLGNISAVVSGTSGAKYAQIDDAQSRLNDLQARERELTATHGPDWPAARALRASIAEARAATSEMTAGASARRDSRPSDVYQSVQTDLLRVTAEAQSDKQVVDLITGQVTDVDKQVGDLEALRAGLAQHKREVDIADSAYRTMSLQMRDSRFGVDRTRDGLSRVAVISQPSYPYRPTSPRYRVLALATAALAVFAGLFVAFAFEFFDDRFRSAKQVSERLQVPVLATFDKG